MNVGSSPRTLMRHGAMFCLWSCLWLGLAAPFGAQAAQDGALQATRLAPGESLVLDGTLRHPAWQRAPVFDRFVEKDPVFGAAPSQRTRFQVLFDDQAVYVGVEAQDTAPQDIRDRVVRKDQVNRTQDFVVVYIDAIGSKRSAQFFRANAAGSLADGLHTAADDFEDFAPDFDWDAAVRRHDGGYTAVFRLPFASLRYAAGPQSWRIMVARRLPRQQFHLFSSVPIPREQASFIDSMQPLQGIELPADSRFLSLRPSLTWRREAPTMGRATQKLEASLDAKWRPMPQAVVDATWRPDFSQVALDVPQLAGNARFALFFPEKRPFFFESADLLRTPTEAIYTRSLTEPRWGLRGTWRGSDWAGTALVANDKGGALVPLPGPYGTEHANQPASDVLLVRAVGDGVAQGLTKGLQLGLVAAARQYAQGRGDNLVLGPDINWQLGKAWRLRGQWLHAQTSALPGSAGALARAAAQNGNLLHAKLLHQSDGVEANLTVDDVSSGFRHDSGFVGQAGVRKLSVWGSRGWNQVGPFNEFWVNGQLERVLDRNTGALVSQDLRPGIWSRGAHNLEWWLELHGHSYRRVSANAPVLQERYVSSGLTVTPARWFPMLEARFAAGELVDYDSEALRPGGNLHVAAKLRPLPALEFETTTDLAWFKHEGQLSYRESALQALAVWHFNARHNLRFIWQQNAMLRRAKNGAADEQRSLGGTGSLTYAWRESSGTVLHLGATRQSRQRPSPSTSSSEVFVKLQCDVGEARRWFGWP